MTQLDEVDGFQAFTKSSAAPGNAAKAWSLASHPGGVGGREGEGLWSSLGPLGAGSKTLP